MEIKKIVSSFYDSNTYVLINDNEEALIVDAGATSEQIKRAFCLSSAKVVGILLTHGHFDHAYYLERYIDRFDCNVYLGREAKELLADPSKNYMEGFSIKAGKKFKSLDGDGELQIGSFNVKYYHTPGHTKCGLCFLIGDDLFTGDTLFKKTIGRTDLYGGRDADMKTSLEKILTIPFKNFHSGHGADGTCAEAKRVADVYIPFLERHSLKMINTNI